MAEYNPDDLIGRTFLFPPNQKGESYRVSIKQKVIEVSQKLDEGQETLAEKYQFSARCGSGEITGHTLIQPSVELPGKRQPG